MLDSLAKKRLIYPVRKLGLLVASQWPFPVKAKLSSGQTMWVDLRSAIGRAILVKGEFDPAVWSAIKPFLPDGGVFLDIGANVGFYSMLASDRVCLSGCVHAFEIDPRPLKCLLKNANTCPNKNITVHPVAVGKEQGHGVLQLASDCGHSSVRPDGHGVQVPMTSLDDWINESPWIDCIDVIKIDIEGGELAALEGARGLVEKYHPAIICEALVFSEGKGVPGQDRLLQFFSDVNYETTFVSGAYDPTIIAIPR